MLENVNANIFGFTNMRTNMQNKKARQQGQAGDKYRGWKRMAVRAFVLAAAMPFPVHGADVRAAAQAHARRLVAQLTLDEKIDQLLNVAPAVPRLGIPAYNWWT